MRMQGEDTLLCGNEVELNAILSIDGSSGYWSGKWFIWTKF